MRQFSVVSLIDVKRMKFLSRSRINKYWYIQHEETSRLLRSETGAHQIVRSSSLFCPSAQTRPETSFFFIVTNHIYSKIILADTGTRGLVLVR